MELTINETFTKDHNDTLSTVYQAFTDEFCTEINNVYKSSTNEHNLNYNGCIVNKLRHGSIVIDFLLYMSGPNQREANIADVKLNSTLNANDYKLGSYVVVTNSLRLINVENIQNLPVFSTALQRTTTKEPIASSTSAEMEDETTSEADKISTAATAQIISTTAIVSIDVICSNATFTIYSAAVFACSLSTSDIDKVKINKIGRNSSTLATIDSNGTVAYISPTTFIVKYFAAEKVQLEFPNITCSDEGTYEIYIMRNMEEVHSKAQISVQKRPSIPRFNMHEDQVIDLQFYRLHSENECRGDVGYPPGRLVIEVKRYNSTVYEAIPSIDITYVENSTTVENCSYTRYLRFGMNYTADMDKGKIRCRVQSVVTEDDISVETDLLLIPREICSCNTVSNGIKRGHPKRCNVYVECREKDFPAGVECPAELCRNSITGKCGSNCSDAVCNEAVPQNFCSTPPPLTTTPVPTPYISCNASMSVMFSESVVIACTLNQTSFNVINITKISIPDSMEEIADILQDGTVIYRTSDDKLAVNFKMEILTIILMNVTCADEGVFRVLVTINGEIAIAQTQLSIIQRPNGYASLKLHPDQIADLGYYRVGSEHKCQADIGYPAGKIKVEILKKGATEFSLLNVTTIISDLVSNCTITREIKFGIVFTSDMDQGVIRCRIESNTFQNDPPIYSNNETLALISNQFCANSTVERSLNPHPADCTKFVQCEGKTVFGLSCQPGLCFVANSSTCDYCNNVVCNSATEGSTTIPLITTTTENSSIYVMKMNCTQKLDFIGSGPVYIQCSFQLSSGLIGINISRTVNSTNQLLATVSSDGKVNMVEPAEFKITYTQTHVSNIELHSSLMSCAMEATYHFIAHQDNVTFKGIEALLMKAKPGTPTLSLSHQTILNVESGQSTCSANVGNPEGSIHILVKGENETAYKKYEGFKQTITKKKLECNTYTELNFTLTFTSSWNNTKVKCQVENDRVIDASEDETNYTSNVDTIVLIQDDYCSGFTGYRQHPRNDCTFYIECDNGRIFSRKCSQPLCFNGNLTICDHCYNVNERCNFV